MKLNLKLKVAKNWWPREEPQNVIINPMVKTMKCVYPNFYTVLHVFFSCGEKQKSKIGLYKALKMLPNFEQTLCSKLFWCNCTPARTINFLMDLLPAHLMTFNFV